MEVKELVQLWMANGLLQENIQSDSEMEDTGYAFFSILLTNSLLEIEGRDKFNNIMTCKMHDLVHDLAETLLRSKHGQNDRFRWLMVDSLAGEERNDVTYHGSCLPMCSFRSSDIVNISSNFKFLQILKLSGWEIKELPLSIGKLIHLRYLDTSETSIKVLPDSVCKLYNLQTLRLYECPHLPDDFRDLVSLRHLHISYHSYLRSMPLEIGKLTHLRTLELFIVGKDRGRRIEELGNLKQLQGKLKIRRLDLVDGIEGARGAELFRKQGLQELEFEWGSVDDRHGIDGNNDQNVLEGLAPHPNSKSISIKNFMGFDFPQWFMNMSVVTINGEVQSLENLMVVTLDNCSSCVELPGLGHLPHLKHLEMTELPNVRQIGISFYGGTNSSWDNCTLFPSLESLSMISMPNLEEWIDPMKATDEAARVTLFPCLKELDIKYCPNLRSAPDHFPCLERLSMGYVNSSIPLIKICTSNTLTVVTIQNIRELTRLPDGLVHFSTNGAPISRLRKLSIWNCNKLRELDDDLLALPHFEELVIVSCPDLKYISISSRNANWRQGHSSLRRLSVYGCNLLISQQAKLLDWCASSLEILEVTRCENLISFPTDLQQLGGPLSSTTVPRGGLGHLTSLRELGFGPMFLEFDSFEEVLSDLPQLSPSLQRLNLVGRPNWKYLPHQIQHLSALTDLRIEEFGVETVPHWLGNLSSLRTLVFVGCPRISMLPSIDVMRHLTKLISLYLHKCPMLEERCTPESQNHPNSQWPKICHIPDIWIK